MIVVELRHRQIVVIEDVIRIRLVTAILGQIILRQLIHGREVVAVLKALPVGVKQNESDLIDPLDLIEWCAHRGTEGLLHGFPPGLVWQADTSVGNRGRQPCDLAACDGERPEVSPDLIAVLIGKWCGCIPAPDDNLRSFEVR